MQGSQEGLRSDRVALPLGEDVLGVRQQERLGGLNIHLGIGTKLQSSSACRARPAVPRQVGDRKQRFPIILCAIVERRRGVRLHPTQPFDVVVAPPGRLPPQRPEFLGIGLAELDHFLVGPLALQIEDDASILKRNGELADGGEGLRCPRVELCAARSYHRRSG